MLFSKCTKTSKTIPKKSSSLIVAGSPVLLCLFRSTLFQHTPNPYPGNCYTFNSGIGKEPLELFQSYQSGRQFGKLCIIDRYERKIDFLEKHIADSNNELSNTLNYNHDSFIIISFFYFPISLWKNWKWCNWYTLQNVSDLCNLIGILSTKVVNYNDML